jgi:peptidoglycan/xylan/chitin deacetylase (PgdA/CDA1 family)
LLAVTVDIEDWYHIPSVTGSPFSRFRDVPEFFAEWMERYDYLTGPTGRVFSILQEYDIRATFFIVADVTEHYPGLVQRIAARGHEIACHGLHHACKIHPRTKQPLVSRQEFEERTRLAREMLEEASGQAVNGYRAPAGYIAGWMIDSLEKLGFKYDSSVSVNSLFNKSDSLLHNVDTRPYYPRRGGLEPGEPREILEIPLPYSKFGIKFPTAGGPMLRFLGARYIRMGLKQSMKRGDTVFYFHPIDISDERFPAFFSLKRPFYWLIKGKIVEKRLESCLSGNGAGPVGTCMDIYQKTIESTEKLKLSGVTGER